MNEEPKTNEDNWSVEPPKKDHQRLKTALRVALIIAALGAVALVGAALIVGNSIQKQIKPMVLGLFGEIQRTEVCVNRSNEQQAQSTADSARAVGDNIVNRGGD